jgi:hypothetical protein
MSKIDQIKSLLQETARSLTGYAKRLFMARTTVELFEGRPYRAEQEMGWNRGTVSKGLHELESGVECADGRPGATGRKPAEDALPQLLTDIRDLVDSQSQTDARFRTHRLYTRMSAAEVRRQLQEKKGYSDEELPSEETLRRKLNGLGYHPVRVQKTQVKKKIPETDAIFEEIKRVREEAARSENQLLISTDAKATVKIGEFSRDGDSRVPVRALDHDYKPDSKATPLGLLLPEQGELSIAVCTSKVTSDCIVDTYDAWWTENKARFPGVDTLVFLQDNGPENSGRRSQFLHRMVKFVEQHGVHVRLAYYPPYHSKYNPVERCWGVLEHHWNGALLDTVEAVVGYAQSMTWKQEHPVVRLVTQAYELGVCLSKKAMKAVESKLSRLPGLPSWFIDIRYEATG